MYYDTLLKIEDKHNYYRISCDFYTFDPDSPYIKSPNDINEIQTGFEYNVRGVGWGCGNTGVIHAQDILNMLRQLRLLKSGKINKLRYVFNDKNFNSGYYFKVIILSINGHYNAYYRIYDDLDVVELWITISGEELDEQIGYFENCAREFPVRYVPDAEKNIEE